jgi:cytochrome c5
MKKLTIAAAVALALAGGLAGCHRNENGASGTASTTTMPNTANSENGTSSVASSSTGSNAPGAPNGNGQDLAAANPVGGGAGANVPGQMTGATSPGDYGKTSADAKGETTAMGAGANGQAVFSQTCAACHAAGLVGAPKLGDKAAWGPRIAQGKNVLYTHALNGFTGKTGTMPPKGGNTTLADADVKAAVDYMVSQAK